MDYRKIKKISFILLLCCMFLLVSLVSCSTESVSTLEECDLNGDGVLNPAEQNNCVGTEEKTEDLDTELQEVMSENIIAHIGVHLETSGDPMSLEYQETYWEDVQDLVALADLYNFKLSLKMTAQWGEYISLDEERLALLQEWQMNGHSVGWHHHGVSHGNWDGYTNDESYMNNEDYIGDIDLMMDTIRPVTLSGTLLVGGGTDEETDWPEETIYETEGYPSESCCLISSVEESDVSGVSQLLVNGYATDKTGAASIEEIEEALLTVDVNGGEYIGITLTDIGFSNHEGEITEMFDLLQSYEVTVVTVEEILG
ncbi:hypothetical protein CL619_03820 [archaeon]|nr:hypothetical protein [archaeon]|tara:strand:- start:1404 stop:2342 length:939 start_codon:yes stop_codon:yes gene_type:complete